jgi:prefoldin alpha subunit
MDKKEQALQEDLILYQLLQKHLEQLGQETALLEKRLAELDATKATIRDMGKMEEGGEFMFPMGSGCFGYGRLAHKRSVMVEIGAGNLIDKAPEAALEFVDERKQEAGNLAEQARAEIAAVSEKMNEIASRLQKSQAAQEAHGHPHK